MIISLIRDEIRPLKLVSPAMSLMIIASLLCRSYLVQSLGIQTLPLIRVVYYAMLSGVVIADFIARHFARKDLYIADRLGMHLHAERKKGPWVFVAVDLLVFLATFAVTCALTLPVYVLLFALPPGFCLYCLVVVLVRTILSFTYVLRTRRH